MNPFPVAHWASSGIDPYFSSVQLLMHCDGTNGSTTIIDSSTPAHSLTKVGGIALSTAQLKYGTASLFFDGSDDQITNNSSDWTFYGNPWTVEAWIRTTTVSVKQLVISHFEGSGGADTNSAWALQIEATGKIQGAIGQGGTITAIQFGSSMSANTWTHVALVRAPTTLYLFRDGNLENTASISSADINTSTLDLRIGARQGNANYFSGYMDDIRITRGIARYTASFTPPAAAFPDS